MIEGRNLTKSTLHFCSPLPLASYTPSTLHAFARTNLLCLLLYTARQPLGAQKLERCSLSIARTSGVGLRQQGRRRAAGGPLLRSPLARLVSRRIRGSERTTRTRARTALLEKRDRMTPRAPFQSHHTVVAAAAAVAAAAVVACRHGLYVGRRACSERSAPAWWRT